MPGVGRSTLVSGGRSSGWSWSRSMYLQVLVLLTLVTVGLVFMLPVEQLADCRCPRCQGRPAVNSQDELLRALGKKDLIVYGEEELNKTLELLNDLELGRRDRLPRTPVLPAGLQQASWVLDCVTWEWKHEVMLMSALEPHDFLLDVYHLGEGEASSKRRNTFQQIFDKRDWPSSDPSYHGLQASGPGALLKNAIGTMSILNVVITKLKQYLNKSELSVLDIPCGDLQWMSKFLLTRSDIIYTGADIVPDIIDHHRKHFDRIPKTQFLQMDVVTEKLNQSYDLVICRDMLQHLWQVDAMKVLEHISSSGSHFVLITTFPDTTQNREVERDALGSRKSAYNLELPPFLLEAPICMSYDWNVEHLALWPLPLKQKLEV